ncbi:MAG TPA: FecR family protein [Patescibacteria group bacterium]|nr:FecR family protein [Patescibacteria group bacterium]
MGRKTSLILSLLTVFLLLAGSGLPAAESIYGHISFVDKETLVIGADGSENRAVVNLPVVPGDTVATSANGRCELQFDNGTVIRLDKNSRLRVTTVLAPSLTSSWEITTLELEEGQLYTLPQSYGREMFQVITPNAAVNLKSRVRATIRLDADGGTSFFSDGGKFQLLYGADSRSLKKATVKANRPLAITAAHVPAERVEKRDIEFLAWNEYVDNHYKELHYGISKVPPKLKFGNSALTYWAEKWSSLYGEWIYDELFGYVWRPADERFAYAARPFFHADFTRIGNELFLIPQQLWGWVPAHMGTWVWMKRGWTWIPGDWFHTGVVNYHGIYTFPTFGYYWNMFISYWYPRPAGEPGWQNRPPFPYRSGVPVLPSSAIDIVKKVVKAPDGNESKRVAIEKGGSAIDGVKLPPAPTPRMLALVPGVSDKSNPSPTQKSAGAAAKSGSFGLARDWNPDNRWAARRGYSIRYANSGNAVICPEMHLSSENFSGVDRMKLRESAQHDLSRTSSTSSRGSSSTSVSDAAARTDNATQDNSGERAKKDDGRK